EVKWDGYRLVAIVVDGRVRLWSRNALEWTDKVPEIRGAIEQLGLKHAALDGELIAGAGTQADFNLLQATLSGEQQGMLTLVLFDLIHVDGVDISGAPLIERKALLEQVLEQPPAHLAYSSHVPGQGQAAYDAAAGQKFEGIISKKAQGTYHHGRSEDWRKTKRIESDEFAVIGATPGKGAREGVGSLLLARPDARHGWVYAGRVGTGFSGEQLRELEAHIGEAGGGKPTVHVPEGAKLDAKGAKWFAPMFVVEVFIRGISNTGVLRQASLKAIRLDKDPADLLDSDQPAGPDLPPVK